MDFMKVLDQTVREIQREVNKKVLKVPEIEQKVLDATSNEPWGPHGSDLAELAHSTRNFTESQMIMNVIWTRLSETGRNWRHVYKALAVIEYLISHGADRVVDDIIEHSYKIAATTDFEYVEPNGKDMGINVRKKSQTILALLSDKDKIQEVRRKAAANKEKYIGLSSSGMSYKSTSAAYGGGGGGFSSSDSSRSHDVSKEDTFDTYKSKEKNWADNDQKTSDRDNINKDDKYASSSLKSEGKSAAKRSPQYGRSKDAASPDFGGTKKLQFKKSKEPQKDDNHEFDDFDPRGSSNASKPENTDDFDPRGSSNPRSTTTTSQKANLFSPNLIDDFIDFPANDPEESSKTSSSAFPANDLFADASFVSAAPVSEMSNSHAQVEVDLFANLPAAQAPFSPEVDLFSKAEPSVPSKMDNFNPSSSDLFASVQLNNFDSADLFGAFTSSTVSQGMEHEQSSTLEGMKNQNLGAAKDSKPPNKKDPFMVKSGVWADSLSRGLIDLNISAPKKTSLKDIGIVGDLTDASEPRRDEKEWFLPTSMQMGKAMGTGSGLGRPGYPPSASGDNTGFSNTSNGFGSFKF